MSVLKAETYINTRIELAAILETMYVENCKN